MVFPRARLLLLSALAASLSLAGCAGERHASSEVPSKKEFLESTGSMQAENGADDPLAMHMAARAQVDPRDVRSHHAYTTTPTREEIYNNAPSQPVIEVAALPEPISPPPPKPVLQPLPMAAAPQDIVPAAGEARYGAASSDVTAVRIGQHPDKTRLVFDLSGPGKFSYGIDPTGKILSVRLPQSGWNAAPQNPGPGGLVKSLRAAPAPGGGVAVNIELSRPGRLAYSGALPPNAVHGDRIVFDVAPL
jgi:hypothetical protein